MPTTDTSSQAVITRCSCSTGKETASGESCVRATSIVPMTWDEVLLPEIERQQKLKKEVVFWADAAFAKPEIYEALEERGVKYAIRFQPTTAWCETSRNG